MTDRVKFKKYQIVSGDTLQLIAQRLLGDANRAMELAALNGLDYPFITDDSTKSSSSVRVAGDTIHLPHEILMEDTIDNLELGELFGSDLLLHSDNRKSLSFGYAGELMTDSYGDLETVSSYESLKQDLIHRLITERGTLPYHPEYGSHFLNIVGERKTPENVQKSIIELTKTFRSDARVNDVLDVNVFTIDTGIYVECNIVVSSGTFRLRQDFNLYGGVLDGS